MRRETRRRFTAPFVLTISAGAAGACAKSGSGTPEGRHSDLGATWYVMKRGDTCSAMEESRCPPNVMCNPPPPRPIACPAGITDDTGVRVTEITAETCAVVPATCNARGCATPPTACPDPWPTAPAPTPPAPAPAPATDAAR